MIISTSVENSWKDPGTGKTFSFNGEGMFLDSKGKGPQKGFQNDDKFGDWLHSYVQAQLLQEGLTVKMVSNNVPIFFSPHAFDTPKKLLVLICGSGRIKSGIWSVGICAYRGLKAGSILPCLEEAKKRDMEVVVLNPNHPNSSYNHSEEIFSDIIIPSNPERVWIIAHSMGGSSTCQIISKNPSWCIQHVKAFALTDGCESKVKSKGYKINEWSHLKGINWIRSEKPLNSPLKDGESTKHRSAETNDHPLTTFMAFPFIWEFFDENGANSDKSPDLPNDFIDKE